MTIQSVRYPAYPLVVHDPYFSIWSRSDRLTDSYPCHWTGENQIIAGLIRIDGKSFCFLSKVPEAPALKQKSVRVLPTRTIYTFEEAGIRFTLTFLTPALPYRLKVLARPITYVCFDAESMDGKLHELEIYFDADAAISVNTPSDEITWSRYQHPELDLMCAGSADQKILAKAGDNLRIDWGYLYFGVPKEFHASTRMESNRITRRKFLENAPFSGADNLNMRESAGKEWLCLAACFPMRVDSEGTSSRYLILAYHDLFSIEYLKRRLSGFWTMETSSFSELLSIAVREKEALAEECARFDSELMDDAEHVGGQEYADLCAGAFRQAVAAHKLVADVEGRPLFFSKENFSNGCIATVDVTYPSAPLFLLCQPELLKGMLIPILDYAESRFWKFPFAPHDLGTYPLANGQVYGGGENMEKNQMPVEECGNMLILAAALVKFHHDTAFIRKYWKTLKEWADYLMEKGYDPENQLCTDDFAGHLAHNTNLSIKAIVALGGFAFVAREIGEEKIAERFSSIAHEFAERWVRDADDGNCFRLAFDRKGSWSQKYNLVWDRLLQLQLFPESVAEKELAHYKAVQNRYGLPLDCRRTYTKLDWILWSASLTGKKEDFLALLEPVHRWLTESVSRVPMTDWYETVEEGRQVGFQARSVVGGVFIKMLENKELVEKWRLRRED